MAKKTGFDLRGVRAYKDLLKKLPQGARKKVVRAALRKGARPIVTAARAAAPRRTGRLRKSIGTVVATEEGKLVAHIGPRSGIKSGGVFYGHLVEFGRSGVGARPFLRPAFDAKAGEAVKLMGGALGQAIEKEARRLSAKGRR
jgi:HK97 gp10 family phage protein